MPLPFILAGLLGKAAVGAVTKGLSSKAAAAGAKTAVHRHGKVALANKLAVKLADKVTDKATDKVVDKFAEKVQHQSDARKDRSKDRA